MPPFSRTLRNYAELGRISNLPTCVSNVLVGCAIGSEGFDFPWSEAPAIAVAICSFYVAGMALNDAADREIDRVERPERPIPSGRVTLRAAYTFVVVAFAVGLGILSAMSPQAFGLGAALVAVIVVYDLFHKRFAGSVLLMGASRGLVYVVAAAAIGWPFDMARGLWLSGALALYTIALTFVARAENQRQLDRRRWLSVVLPVVVLAAGFPVRAAGWLPALPGGAVLTAWLVRAAAAVFQSPPDTKKAVLTWISGMCLVDMYFLTALGHPPAALAALGCFLLTAYSHRHVMGT